MFNVILFMCFRDIKHTIVHRAGSGRAKGLLWLIEQIPGRTHSADLSDAFLEKTYWATYGLPFFVVSTYICTYIIKSCI